MPIDIIEAKRKIDKLDKVVEQIKSETENKHKAPSLPSVTFFLSYFCILL
jgi:hypothetical protein